MANKSDPARVKAGEVWSKFRFRSLSTALKTDVANTFFDIAIAVVGLGRGHAVLTVLIHLHQCQHGRFLMLREEAISRCVLVAIAAATILFGSFAFVFASFTFLFDSFVFSVSFTLLFYVLFCCFVFLLFSFLFHLCCCCCCYFAVVVHASVTTILFGSFAFVFCV